VVGHETESINVEGMNGTLRLQNVEQESHEPRMREYRSPVFAADGYEIDLAT